MEFEIFKRGKVPDAKPMVSVLVNTFRSGGLDITLAGMRDQFYDKSKFEVIVVDHRYEKRHKEVVAMAKDYGIQNFTHVPEYQRNGKWCSFASAWNTAFMLAEGDISIILIDYAYAPPQWIEKHVSWLYDSDGNKLKRFAIGPHSHHSMPAFVFYGNDIKAWIQKQDELRSCCLDQMDFGKVFGEMSIFEKPFDPIEINRTTVISPPHQDPKLLYETGRCTREFVHIKNESYWTESIYEINGCDEIFEYGKGPMDNEFGARFERSGHELVFDRSNVIFVFNPRFLMATMPWGNMNTNEEGRWSYNQGESFQNQRYNDYSNGLPAWAPNSYSLREKRKELLPWKKLSEITPDMIKQKPPCMFYPALGTAAKDREHPRLKAGEIELTENTPVEKAY